MPGMHLFLTCPVGRLRNHYRRSVPKSFLAAFLTVIRTSGTVSRFATFPNSFNRLDSPVAKLFGQCFVAAITVISVVSNDFCHNPIIKESIAKASTISK